MAVTNNAAFLQFVLEDRGHLGMYGLLYSDSLRKIENSPNPRQEDGGFWLRFVKERLGPKWWYAYNDTF